MSDSTAVPASAAPSAPKTSKLPSGRTFAFGVIVTMLVAATILGVLQRRTVRGTVTVGSGADAVRVSVTVAATDLSREQGLSGREGLGPDEGMYFVFDRPGTYGFWMKDMRFPIDIVWIANGAIADLTENVQPPGSSGALPSYAPKVPVDRVLEAQAGFISKHGLQEGMPVTEGR